MKNILLAGDLHISQDSLEECAEILEEQKQMIKEYGIDTYISTGDNFDTLNPGPKALDLFASFLRDINIPAIIIAAQSHESLSPEETILTHFGILNRNIKVVSEFKDGNILYVGHFIVAESKLNKFGASISKAALKNYFISILGHGHNFELIPPNIIQLGSSRFVRFDESIEKFKMVAVLQNYDSKMNVQEIPLRTPIPMKDIVLASKTDEIKQIQTSTATLEERMTETARAKSQELSIKIDSVNALCTYLNSLTAKNKVRVTFKNYDLWREFLNVEDKYKNKFVIFKEKKEFTMSCNLVLAKKENISLRTTLIEWLEKNNIEEKIRTVLLEEVK